MTNSLLILGRQPAFGLAELEAVFGSDKVSKAGHRAAIVEESTDRVNLSRLGGSLKVGKVLEIATVRNWEDIKNTVETKLLKNILELPEGKIQLGVSCYGIAVNAHQVTGLALDLKKLLRQEKRSVRIIPNVEADLSTAQVQHNHLTGTTGVEVLLVLDQNTLTIAQTVDIQDIAAYAARDQQRPMRDAKIGMLPPKLALMMINMVRPESGNTILDPFCGTGVILQESLLMGCNAVGSDLDPRMVDYSRQNMEWLARTHGQLPNWQVSEADATKHSWASPVDLVVCETFLGRPLFQALSHYALTEESKRVNQIVESFLTNISRQLSPGARLCVAVPAWKIDKGFLSLSVLDHLEKIGYNSASFKNVRMSELIYHRPQQLVARQLLVLVKK